MNRTASGASLTGLWLVEFLHRIASATDFCYLLYIVPRFIFTAPFALGAVLCAAGQSAGSHATEPLIIRHAEMLIDMKADGTGEQTETMVVSIQSESAAKQYGVIGTFYAKQSQHADFVYVRVRHRSVCPAQIRQRLG